MTGAALASASHSPQRLLLWVGGKLGIDPSLLLHSSLLLLATMTGQIVSFAVQIVVARSVDVEAYGTYSYALTWVNLLALVGVLGGDRLLARYVAEYRARGDLPLLRAVIVWTLLRGFAWGTVLAIGFLLFAGFRGTGAILNDPGLLTIAAFAVPVLVIGDLSENVLRASGAQLWANLPGRVLRPVLMGVFFGGLLLFQQPPLTAAGALGSNVAAIALSVGLSLWALCCVLPPRTDRASSIPARSWLLTSMTFGVGTMAIYLNGQSAMLLLGSTADPREVGIYAAVTRLVAVMAFANTAVVQTSQPMIASLADDASPAQIQSLISGGARFAFLVNLAVALPVILLAGPILAVFGPDFVEGATALRVLVSSFLLASAVSLSGTALSMRGFERDATLILIGGCAVTLLLCFVLIPAFGLNGAATATAGSMLAWNGALLLLARVRLGVWVLPFLPRRAG